MDKFYKCIVYAQHKDVEDDMDSRDNYFPAKSFIDLSEIIGWYETPFHKDMGLEQTIVIKLRNGGMSNVVTDCDSFAKVIQKYNSQSISFVHN